MLTNTRRLKPTSALEPSDSLEMDMEMITDNLAELLHQKLGELKSYIIAELTKHFSHLLEGLVKKVNVLVETNKLTCDVLALANQHHNDVLEITIN